MLHTLNLNHVITFLSVAECGSFRAAAERLHIAQSAISVRVRLLEEDLGVPLFHRTTRSVTLTSEGIRLVAVAKRISVDIENVALELREESTLQRGLIAVTSVPSLAAILLPQLISRFRAMYPGILFKLLDTNSAQALELVKDGKADLGILSTTDVPQRLIFEHLFWDECFVIAPADGHPLSHRAWVSLEEVTSFPLLANPKGTMLRDTLESAFRSVNKEVAPSQEAYNSLTLVGLVKAGHGVTILPRTALSGLELTHCRKIRIRQHVSRDVGIVRATGRSESPAAAVFRQFIQTEAPTFAAALQIS